jgi:hypothetical protein
MTGAAKRSEMEVIAAALLEKAIFIENRKTPTVPSLI